MPDSLRSRTPLEVRHLFDLIRSRRADPIYRLMGALVHEGDAVADIGANRGWYTGRLAELVGPSGHVHVFEPNPLHWPPLHAIAGYFEANNQTPKPFVWARTADQILASIARFFKRINGSGH